MRMSRGSGEEGEIGNKNKNDMTRLIVQSLFFSILISAYNVEKLIEKQEKF